MQTIYYTTQNFIQHRGNVVDLEDYRRRLALTQEGSLAPSPREDCPAWGEEPPVRREAPARPPRLRVLPPREDPAALRRERRALLLDLWASVGVLVMTLAFLLRLLLG